MRRYLDAVNVQMVIAACATIIVGNSQLLGAIPTAHAQTEKPEDIVATQIRRQGYECGKAESAKRDRAASKPDEAVWVLQCDNATYRVRLHQDMAAEVNNALQRETLRKQKQDRLRRAEELFGDVVAELSREPAGGLAPMQALQLKLSYTFQADCAFDLGSHSPGSWGRRS